MKQRKKQIDLKFRIDRKEREKTTRIVQALMEEFLTVQKDFLM